MNRPFLGVLGSGRGSNFQAIYQSIQQGKLQAEIKIVMSDVAEAGILQKAKDLQIPNFLVDDEKQTIALLQKYQVDLVILAGFMRILSPSFLQAFPNRILNIHPSLLPKFPGKEAWKQARQSGEKETGCTVHLVTEKVDQGPILAQRKIPILPSDSPESIHQKIQTQEHVLYSATIANYWKTLH